MNKLVINNKEFKNLVAKICRDITISNWRPDYVVGITRGGLMPAVMISHYFGIPCETLKVSLRDGGECESNLWMASDAFGSPDDTIDFYREDPLTLIRDDKTKNILLVDDINDSGTTFNWILNDWQQSHFPDDPVWENDVWNQNVKFAVVVDNLASKCKVPMDFAGMEINKSENNVWVEFPYEEWWSK
jgi:xanthine phosphoribosyltransferase